MLIKYLNLWERCSCFFGSKCSIRGFSFDNARPTWLPASSFWQDINLLAKIYCWEQWRIYA